MHEVKLAPGPFGALTAVLPAGQRTRLESTAAEVREALAGRVVWNVSATETGGGVAEMLPTLLGYLLAAGVESRWLVLDGDEKFFAVTKCLHNALHGAGDLGDLGHASRGHYQRVLIGNLPVLLRRVHRHDLVLLHDPQSAGLLPPLKEAGIQVAWRSHIGRDVPNERSVAAWEFLREYVEAADALVFSRQEHAPGWADRSKLRIISPSIDPLAPKNRRMTPARSAHVLARAGLLAVEGNRLSPAMHGATALAPGGRLILQVSRWDRLKDMAGVMAGFAHAKLPGDTHLVLAGPAVTGVSDDPEGAAVLNECLSEWRALPSGLRDRVALVSVPMDDVQQNATIVNALQRQATVITQKSLAEGFGLTVAEAMWKAKPVIASAVGGIQDQITDGQDGLLIQDPRDLDAFARALWRLVANRDFAQTLARAAHQRVRDNFLDDRHLIQSADLFRDMAAMGG
jgi:trehalose synthase